MPDFVFGGNTGLTYDQLQQRRKMAEALMMGGMQAQPKTAWDGLNAAARSIAGALIDRKLGSQEKAQQSAFSDQYKKFLSGLGGNPSATTTAPGMAPVTSNPSDPLTNAYPTGQDASVFAATHPHASDPTAYNMGEMADMPKYEAAIKGNESGGNYSAVGPAVTRNGSTDHAYGAYQVMGSNIPTWTQEVLGKSMTPQEFLANPDAQDAVFKAKFGGDVQKYGNPQDAASVWFSGKPQAQAGNASDGQTTVPEYVSGFNAGLNGTQATPAAASGDIAQLAALAASPYASPSQKAVIGAMLQQRMAADEARRSAAMKQSDPAYQTDLALKKAQLKQLESGGPAPSAVQEYNFYAKQAQDAGQHPMQFNDWLTAQHHAAANTVNVNGADAKIGQVPPGYVLVPDQNSAAGYRAVPVPGGPADQKAHATDQQNKTKAETRGEGAAVIGGTINGLLSDLENGNVSGPRGRMFAESGMGSFLEAGSKTGDFVRNLQSLRDKIGVDRLLQIKASGAGLGQVPQSQLESLGRTLGTLDAGLSNEQLIANMRRVKTIYQSIINESLKDANDPTFRGMVGNVIHQADPANNSEPTGQFDVIPHGSQGAHEDSGHNQTSSGIKWKVIQ